jgi:beta-lactamase regulating signal transducer with metallopeptidase domain
MNELLLYLAKSTLSLSLLYLAFRAIMHKETVFGLNRMVLLTIVAISFIIPLLYLPLTLKPIIQEQIIPQVSIYTSEEQATAAVEMNQTTIIAPFSDAVQQKKPHPFSTGKIIFLVYLAGMLLSFLVFMHGIIAVLLMLKKAKVVKKEGYLLLILEKDIPAFSFWKMVFISSSDYAQHETTILAHEQQHIRLGHFYDLILMEMVKTIHWFNPIIYWLIKDLKAIHEFQADQHTLTKGIDVKKYQLLIIEKGVGPRGLSLANSFNHCQIKKRITMMNKQKTSKAGMWKVATFLPLLALLLMAFGKTGENVTPEMLLGPDGSTTTSEKIEGAWKTFLSQKIENGKTITLITSDSKYTEMKVWTKDYYAYVGNQGYGSYSFGGSGTYKLNGNLYEENIIYSPVGSTQGQTVKLILEIKNDTLTQIWPIDASGKYDKLNCNIIKMVKMK